MVVVFYGVAGLMVVAGLASLVQGMPYVRLEVGWTMVIAGTVAASGGALLAGVAAVLGRLGRLERTLRERPALAGGAPAVAPAIVAAPRAPLDPPPLPAGTSPVADGATPRVNLDFRPTLDASGSADPPPVPVGPGPEAPAAEMPRGPDLPAFADLPPVAEGGASAKAGPASVIGTYSSGGNGYVMFSDGSIEAETPRGRYRFGSLDELKAFIAAGGEDGPGEPAGAARAAGGA